ncbi:MAG: LCP family protein [Chloroflexales bacterium]|nr:LCP family protein [Chloroflexales bacterium]
MRVPRSRWITGTLALALLLVVALGVRLGVSWQRALSDVDAMIVTPVALPTETPAPVLSDALAVATAAPLPTAESPLPDSPLNILLLGTDARLGDSAPTRTDAIVLVHLDRKDGSVSILSFPRDLWVTYPGYGQGRINAAYATGEKKIRPGAGATLAKATVSKLTGLPIHHFVLVNFAGFKTLIDKLGGISVDVPKAIDDPAFPTDNYGTIAVHFNAGQQLMDGERALVYARTRHADSDFGRNQRQQQVLLAIFDKVRANGLFAQFTNVDEYTGAVRDYVKTDRPRGTMFDLARWGRNLSGNSLHSFRIEPSMVVMLKNPATFTAEPRALKKLVGQITGEAVSAAGGTTPER